MTDWADLEPQFHNKYIKTMSDIIENTINDGEISIHVDRMGFGTIDVNNSVMSCQNFRNYMKHFSSRFHFSIIEIQD